MASARAASVAKLLAGVVRDEAGFDQVQFKPGSAPRYSVQYPQSLLDDIDERGAQGRRRGTLIRVDQTQLLAEHVVSQCIPTPPGQIVRKLVQLEVIVECASHHVMFERRIGCGPNRVEQLAKVRATLSDGAASEIAVEEREGLSRAHGDLQGQASVLAARHISRS